MHANLLTRRIHYWLTLGIGIPIVVVILSGILLQVKKQFSWIQPTENSGHGTEPVIGFPQLLASIQTLENYESATWKDIKRIDVRPNKGIAKVTLKGDVEVQVDLGNGDVLQKAIRRSDWIESLHDGSYFGGDVTKLGLFLPAAIGLLMMWVSGIWLFALPILAKRKKRLRSASNERSAVTTTAQSSPPPSKQPSPDGGVKT